MKSTLNKNKWAGLLIGFLGFIPIFIEKYAEESRVSFVVSWPEAMMLCAVICSVYGWIQLKKIVSDGYPAIMANGFAMFWGGALSLTHSWLVEDWAPFPVLEWQPFLIYSTLLLIISNIICYNLYGVLLKKYSATLLAFAGNTIPMFAALLGWIFLGEEITWLFCLSVCIVTYGLFLFQKEELKKTYLQTHT